MSIETQKSKYDVALSFAQKNRPVADSLAKRLTEKGLHVFYEPGNVDSLWGQDLHAHLNRIYRNTRICLIFLSLDYTQNSLASFVMKYAAARALTDPTYHLIPIRLDDSPIPSQLHSFMCRDGRDINSHEFINEIAQKVHQIQEIECQNSSETLTESYHIIPRYDGWSVKRSGSSRAVRLLPTKEEALNYAKGVLKSSPSREIIIHNPDGSVNERIGPS